jgi:demethylmenaquinone methyltransferase / 2-methoxy-6-polyprenyl-1,4-benzoquinol methylase
VDAPSDERGGPPATGPRRLSTPDLEADLKQLAEHVRETGRPGDQAPPVERKTETTESKPRRIREMFGAIVPRYDLINWLMTLGLDRRWRRLTVALSEPHDAVILDIATGTGDLACEAAWQGARRIIGADFCPPMVAVARVKAARLLRADSQRGGIIDFVVGDAMRLPFPARSFDAVVNGFLLRNVEDLATTFAELCRVIKPGGRLVCLDLTPPRGAMRHFFAFYIATAVPLLGILVGRNYGAYRYLFQSLKLHPDADRIAGLMRAAGFAEVSYTVIGFGTVAIHLGRK